MWYKHVQNAVVLEDIKMSLVIYSENKFTHLS